MRAKSHRELGRYLADRYLPNVPKRHIRAFILGCTEPDKNPTTYIKGSLRRQWLRGHNYGNSRRYMQRICLRLERRKRMNILDYYTLGKLIHYTADAFTYVHNENFTDRLANHRRYEILLQNHFLEYLQSEPGFSPVRIHSPMMCIHTLHRDYIRKPADIRTDARFALRASECVMQKLISQ